MSCSPKVMEPLVGASIPPRRFSSVVLPEPDGPENRHELAALDGEFVDVQRLDLDLAHLVDAADVAHDDEIVGHVGHGSSLNPFSRTYPSVARRVTRETA